MAAEKDGIPQYSVDEVKDILAQGKARVIDVRTEEEYVSGHIPGVPLRPMQEVQDWMGELDPNEAYVFVCRSGNRSQQVALFLKQQGFSRVANCAGGMLAWNGDVREGREP
ncbi:MAG: rhodanese-like domain-containing protein [Alicyclobacillaceae bacterium]|nr:rhodanese-like domain-containing protein [Alicyclobacillaceae bacterium]